MEDVDPKVSSPKWQRPMRIVWVGFHQEGREALQNLLASEHKPVLVVTLDESGLLERSASWSCQDLCREAGVEVVCTSDANDPATVAHIRDAQPDLLLVIGWSQILRDELLNIPTLGTVGTHASLLPRNRGSAPVNWSLIRGESTSGNTMMWLDSGVDTGRIIDQVAFPITQFDTCATLYGKVEASNSMMISRLLHDLQRGPVPGRRQPSADSPVLPRRRPADGRISWSWRGHRIYDFIRGLTRPYPGAFTTLGGERIVIWSSVTIPGRPPTTSRPGEVIGPLVSPIEEACGVAVACGEADLVGILEIDYRGQTLRGPQLADLLPVGTALI